MGPRRRFTPELKTNVVLEWGSGPTSSAALCHAYQIASSVPADWKAGFLARTSSRFKNPAQQEVRSATKVAESERPVGPLTPEHDLRKKSTSLLQQRSRPDMRSGTCSANRIMCARSAVCWAMRAAAMRRPCRRPAQHPRTTRSNHAYPCASNLVQGLTIVRSNWVWVGDMTYVRVPREFVDLAVVMGVATGGIRGWHLGRPRGPDTDLVRVAVGLGPASPLDPSPRPGDARCRRLGMEVDCRTCGAEGHGHRGAHAAMDLG